MKLLVLDYLWRYRWIFIGAFILHFLALLASWHTPTMTIVICVVGGSSFLLFAELSRHGANLKRTLLALPVRAKDLAASWRFVGLEFPILFFLVALILSAVVGHVFMDAPHLSVQRVVIAGVFQSLLLGVAYFAMAGLPLGNAAQRNLKDQVRGGFFGLIWGFSIPGSMFLMNTLPTNFSDLHPAHYIAAAIMSAATAAGWFRSGLLTKIQRTSGIEDVHRKPGQPTNGSDVKADIAGFGALRYMMFRFGRTIGLFGIVILLINWYGMRFFFGRQFQGEQAEQRTFAAMDTQLDLAMPIMGLIVALSVIPQLRILRSLPISRVGLTHFLIFWPLAFSCVFVGVASYLYWALFGGPIGDPDYWYSFAAGLISLAGIPIILHFGLKLPVLFGIFFLFPFFAMVRTFAFGEAVQYSVVLSITFLVATAVVIASWFFTYRLLGSSGPWRAGSLRIPGQMRSS